MSSYVTTLVDHNDNNALPITALKALVDDNGNPIDDTLTASDVNALKNGKIAYMDIAISSLIAMQPFESSPITISAGSTGSWEIDVSKTGYTAIGIMGFWISSGSITILEWYINNQNAHVYAYNSGSSSLTNAKVRPYILYVKNFS